MVDDLDPFAAARPLLAGLPAPHVAELGRELRRRALPSRSARPADVAVAVVAGGVWLGVRGKAGVVFSLEGWAGFSASCLKVLVEASGERWPSGGPPAPEAPGERT